MDTLTLIELDVRLDADATNTEGVPYTFRFAFPRESVPHDSIPALREVSITPAVVDPGRSIGQRATVTVGLVDFLYPLAGTAYTSGTFFGKLRARRRSLQGCALRVLRGEVGDELADMVTAHYSVESLKRSADDQVTIVAKDLLKLTNGDRAQAPRVSRGRLLSAINDTDVTATLTPTGVGDLDYPASGEVAIGGSEICAFTRAGDVLTITRAQADTTAKDHSADELAQLVLQFSALSPAVIVYQLLDGYTDIAAEWLPLSEWQDDIDEYIGRLYSAHIATPTDVDKLLNEIIEQAGLVMYWDPIEREVRLKSLRPVTGARTVNTSEMLAGSFSFVEQPEKRISRVVTFFALTNPLAKLDDPNNFRSTLVTADLSAEDASEYGQAAVYKIFSRWIALNNRTAAARLNSLLLSRYRDPPRKLELDLYKASSEQPTLAQGMSLEHWALQDADGEIDAALAQVISLGETEDRWQLSLEEVLFADVSDVDDGGEPGDTGVARVIVIDSSVNNVNLRTLHDSFYIAPDADTELVCIIEGGVVIGSSTLGGAALDIGSWPAGAAVTVVNNGRVQGYGGGGSAGSVDVSGDGAADTTPDDGQDGGTALYTRYAFTLENNGELLGGGGGGAGGNPTMAFGAGDYGGGGAGTLPGSGVSNGTADAGGAGANGSGAGGNPGQPGIAGGGGAQGGAAGDAVDGHSFVTYTAAGTITGGQVN